MDPKPQHKDRMRELALDFARTHQARDLYSLGEAAGARLVFMDLGERDGAYDPVHKAIIINPTRDLNRQKFTLAHEIAHALLLDDDELLSDIHEDFEGDGLEVVIEKLCDWGAANILIEPEVLKEVTDRHGISAQAVMDLSRKAQISLRSAMVAIAEHAQTPALIVLFQPAAPQKPLIVNFTAQNALFKYTLTLGQVLPQDHAVQVSFDTRLPLDEDSYVPFASGKKMPAHLTTYPEKHRVVGVFRTR
ncbi:ImmA/IrrE family metallo-endopeptidase [Deinococcus roseus]|uniref:Radiation response metalloprotease IrrE n=1 Tax=Deinococcus roseus TaxID=392414 RepID=A0ABQ2DE63_9DEIO|nr:ImmA/IrrE family metallo-endopeptidase [Deinococcus roseus]GGJ54289.1 radiation response metalloprotease IrrE [Deinococcus roseus]